MMHPYMNEESAWQRLQDMQRVLVRRVDVLLLGRHGDLDLVLVVLARRDDPEVRAHFVVPLRAPRHVVRVRELGREKRGR